MEDVSTKPTFNETKAISSSDLVGFFSEGSAAKKLQFEDDMVNCGFGTLGSGGSHPLKRRCSSFPSSELDNAEM